MSEPPPDDRRTSDEERPPGTVLATAILLYVGGGLLALYGLIGVAKSGPGLPLLAYLLFGGLFLGLGWAVQRGRPWARVTVLALCGVGFALALIRFFTAGPATAVRDLAWPVVYTILLSTRTARSWFRAQR